MRITGVKIISSSLLSDKPIMSQLDSNLKNIPLQYQGFVRTPSLWFGNTIYGLNQFEYSPNPNTELTNLKTIPNRLGKRVEHFVCEELNQLPHTHILAQNLQIQQNKHTIGELDTLIKHGIQIIHLEIVYKYYLYDPSAGTTHLDHWIGPNRKDSLIQKLDKLKNKQLPLLYKPETTHYLKDLGLKSSIIEQYVLFKAQLFVPRSETHAQLPDINPNCIMGYYIKQDALPAFQNCMFYIPSKINWLITIQPDVAWLSYNPFLEAVSVFLDRKQAPLIWIKHPNGIMERCFVVWW